MATLSAQSRQQLKELGEGNPPPLTAGLFGATIPEAEAQLVLIPTAWEATTSYGQGTAQGPEAMRAASHQLDLFDLKFGRPYLAGITLGEINPRYAQLNRQARKMADRVIEHLTNQQPVQTGDLAEVNQASQEVNELVYQHARTLLQQKKFVGVLGGDHSCPLGLIKALGEVHKDGFGILHIDAHHDLRQAYEGFTYSHASIMYNVMEEVSAVSALTSVAIRDFSQFEHDYAKNHKRIHTFYDAAIQERQLRGESFAAIAADIVRTLPEKVYISFDIDGLDPFNCPHTGTPVPGGLEYNQAIFLIHELVAQGRKIVGFDLCEVAPSETEWDANVGARILYKLCGALVHSQKLATVDA